MVPTQESGGRERDSSQTRGAAKPLSLTVDEDLVVRTMLAALRRIQHGSVHLLVQDSRVVQIDTVEKTRMARSIPVK